jgi:predicted DsbA family dithiol-disulfide isomerase
MSTGDGIHYVPWARQDFPHWSLPALEAAKCVARQGDAAFDRVHLALYAAFFTGGRNIADPREVIAIVGEAGADVDRFVADYRAGVGREAVVRDWEAAAADGVRSIPTVVVPATGRALVGLATAEQYRAAFEEAARC